MIHDISNLLRSFAEREVEVLEAAGIRHAPTVGEMYEGLTADILGRTIPPGLDLKVVSGFAEDHNGKLSNQIDCMLVRGEGTPGGNRTSTGSASFDDFMTTTGLRVPGTGIGFAWRRHVHRTPGDSVFLAERRESPVHVGGSMVLN